MSELEIGVRLGKCCRNPIKEQCFDTSALLSSDAWRKKSAAASS